MTEREARAARSMFLSDDHGKQPENKYEWANGQDSWFSVKQVDDQSGQMRQFFYEHREMRKGTSLIMLLRGWISIAGFILRPKTGTERRDRRSGAETAEQNVQKRAETQQDERMGKKYI